MNSLEELLLPLQNLEGDTPERLLYALLLAFIVGQLNAWCYKWTHRGVSYSRTFTHALVLITIIAALSMTLILTNPLVAVGLLGGMAIIRFRTVVRDARDNAYVLLCLICGMAAGLGNVFATATGSIVANLVALYLHQTGFGGWRSMESLLRFQMEASRFEGTALTTILKKFCRKHSVVSVDEAPSMDPDGAEIYQYVYKVKLRDSERAADLVSALRAGTPIQAVHLLVDQENEEVA